MASILSPFVLGQAVGVTSASFLAFSNVDLGATSAIKTLEKSHLPLPDRSRLVAQALKSSNKALVGSVLLGSTAFASAFVFKPDWVHPHQARSLPLVAGLLAAALVHSRVVLIPIYDRVAAVQNLKDGAAEQEWKAAMKSFRRANAFRSALFITSYGLGVAGLAFSTVTL